MSSYETLLTNDHRKLMYLTNQRLFFLNFLSQEQKEQVVVNFIKNGFFSDGLREFFHDKPEFIIRMAHRCGWDVNNIAKFVYPKLEGNNIESTIIKSYVMSIISQEEKVDEKSCKKKPQLPPKSELDKFLELKPSEITLEKIISVFNVKTDYTEFELHKILNHANKAVQTS